MPHTFRKWVWAGVTKVGQGDWVCHFQAADARFVRKNQNRDLARPVPGWEAVPEQEQAAVPGGWARAGHPCRAPLADGVAVLLRKAGRWATPGLSWGRQG
jgi:hypothetical protein